MAKKQTDHPEPTSEPEVIIIEGLPNKPLLRIDEAAAYFCVTTRCIRDWVDSGILTAKQPKEKGAIRVTRESILNCRSKNR